MSKEKYKAKEKGMGILNCKIGNEKKYWEGE